MQVTSQILVVVLAVALIVVGVVMLQPIDKKPPEQTIIMPAPTNARIVEPLDIAVTCESFSRRNDATGCTDHIVWCKTPEGKVVEPTYSFQEGTCG